MRDADGVVWSLGRPGFAAAGADDGADFDTVLRRDGVMVAGFRFRDMLRPESRPAVDWLRARGHAVEILSGDKEEKVMAVAAQLGLPAAAVHAGMSPEAKADWVRQRGGRAVPDALPRRWCERHHGLPRGRMFGHADDGSLAAGGKSRFLFHRARARVFAGAFPGRGCPAAGGAGDFRIRRGLQSRARWRFVWPARCIL